MITEEELGKYMLEVDENYYRIWTKGKGAYINRHPVVQYEITKGLDIPGVITWLKLSRILLSKNGSVSGIMLSYKDGEYKRRTVTVPMDKEKKLRVIAMREISDFIFRVVEKV